MNVYGRREIMSFFVSVHMYVCWVKAVLFNSIQPTERSSLLLLFTHSILIEVNKVRKSDASL